MEKFMEWQNGNKNKKTLYRMYDVGTVETLLGKLNDYLAERFWEKELPKRINFEKGKFAISCFDGNDDDPEYILVDGTDLSDNACLLFPCESSDKDQDISEKLQNFLIEELVEFVNNELGVESFVNTSKYEDLSFFTLDYDELAEKLTTLTNHAG